MKGGLYNTFCTPQLSAFCSSSRRRGATLVELIVVLAIILILLCVASPGILLVKQYNGQVSCMQNLHHILTALSICQSRNRQYLLRPPTSPSTAVPLDQITGDMLLRLMAAGANRKDFICPASTDTLLEGFIEPKAPFGISYIYLPGVKRAYTSGKPTFVFSDVWAPCPDSVVVGDRVVKRPPGPPFLAGSNHGDEGGWFGLAGGNVQWKPFDQLTVHPVNSKGVSHLWYWPESVFAGKSAW